MSMWDDKQPAWYKEHKKRIAAERRGSWKPWIIFAVIAVILIFALHG